MGVFKSDQNDCPKNTFNAIKLIQILFFIQTRVVKHYSTFYRNDLSHFKQKDAQLKKRVHVWAGKNSLAENDLFRLCAIKGICHPILAAVFFKGASNKRELPVKKV